MHNFSVSYSSTLRVEPRALLMPQRCAQAQNTKLNNFGKQHYQPTGRKRNALILCPHVTYTCFLVQFPNAAHSSCWPISFFIYFFFFFLLPKGRRSDATRPWKVRLAFYFSVVVVSTRISEIEWRHSRASVKIVDQFVKIMHTYPTRCSALRAYATQQ